jgi:hypothetical protein
LLAALKIVQRGDLPLREMIGAYAGEIGQTQFLPSSYIKYGVDFDGDGHVDLRHSVADVLASTANLLHTNGFRMDAPYGEGTANFEAMREWNHATIYRKTIGYFAIGWWGGDALYGRQMPGLRDASDRHSRPSAARAGTHTPRPGCLSASADGFLSNWRAFAGTTHETWFTASLLLQRFAHLLAPLRHYAPVGGGAQALQKVHEAGVAPDQDARLVFFDALDDAKRCVLWRGFGELVEQLDRLHAPLIVGDAGAHAHVAHDVGRDAAGMHYRKSHRALGNLQFVAQGFRKGADGEFCR